MSIIVRRYLGRSRLAEELVEDWLMVEHRSAMFAQDVEELVAECLDLEKMSKFTWKHVLDMLYGDCQEERIDEIGQAMKTATSKIADVFGRVGKLMMEAKQLGHIIKASDDFVIASDQIARIKSDVENKFPPINEEMVRNSLEAYKRGAYQSAEDLLRESQSQSA